MRYRRIAFLSISSVEAQNSDIWAKEKGIPVNDAMMGENMMERNSLIYTVDEGHFKNSKITASKF